MCEELKHIPQGSDTSLMEITGEKALAVKTLGTVAIVSLQADGSVGNSFTSPGKRAAALTASSTGYLPLKGLILLHGKEHKSSQRSCCMAAVACVLRWTGRQLGRPTREGLVEPSMHGVPFVLQGFSCRT